MVRAGEVRSGVVRSRQRSALRTAGAELEWELHGTGDPVTVLAHGVGATIAETRLLGVGVGGTQAFLHFRGHGGSRATDGRWDYAALAADLRAVADEAGATRALGVSMGAAALLHLLLATPERFSRLVFFLPAVLDRPRADVGFERLARMADLVEAGGEGGAVAELATFLLGELPAAVQQEASALAWTRQRAVDLAGSGVAHLLRALPPLVPVTDRRELAAVTVPALVIGQEGDDVHPARVARELAAALPGAELVVFGASGALWESGSRARLRGLLVDFLG